MFITFAQLDLPIAYSMIRAAKRQKPRQDGYHAFHKYFYYWAAFNNIYTTIAYSNDKSIGYKKLPDGSIATKHNGSVKIAIVIPLPDKHQINMARTKFDEVLKHKLISHPSTMFFANRIPCWNGKKITTDDSNQRLNGVININHTIDTRYPVWSPIEKKDYEQYLNNSCNKKSKNNLVRQILDILYTIRCNLMHGGKRIDDDNDVTVVENALPLLAMIVDAFCPIKYIN